MKMKSILKYIPFLAVGIAFNSCSFEQDDLFDASAAERLNEASKHYTELFAASKGGWAMEYYPNTDKRGAVIMMNFNSNDSVETAMNNSYSSDKYISDKSCWEIITDLGPVLSFNSWSDVIHTFSNPENPSGRGYEGDYEFVITDAKDGADHLMVKGKKRGIYQRMTRMPEGTDYKAYLEEVNSFTKKIFPEDCPNYLILELGDSIYEVEDMEYTSPDIWPYNADKVSTVATYYYTMTKQPNDSKFHLRFNTNVPAGAESHVRELVYNADKDVFEDMDNPAYVLRGPIPAEFFMREIGTASYLITPTSEKGDGFNTIYTAMRQAFAALSTPYTINNITIRGAERSKVLLTMAFSYKSGKKTYNGTFRYQYLLERKDNSIVLSYEGAYDTGSENAYNTLPALQSFLQSLSRTFNLKAKTTNFNLDEIIYTASDDNNIWFVPVYNK